MGAAVSSGQDNDELVDNLMESGYIRTKRVEQVFRAVDRADYVLPSSKENAYKDLAWKHGNIHLSAPCVYSEVMEGLSLAPGLSFLNLGSGTGYLSTMAGLILKQHGTNHGIELHEDCLKYAYERLEEFKQKSLALDEFDFCEPLFIQGNCLSIAPGRQYDRVYCGAACPESHESFIKQFVSVGGILVMPFKDHLLRVQRIDENNWSQTQMLPVSFATLIIPVAGEQNLFHLPECDPLSLQELCRGKIRHRLRQNVWYEHADLETRKPILPGRHRASPPQQTLRRFVIPIFEESDEVLSDEDDEFSMTARLLLNVDTHPGEAITTTVQLVRAVIQPNRNENRPNMEEVSDSDGSGPHNAEQSEPQSRNVEDKTESSKEESLQNSEETNVGETSSDSTADELDSQGQSQKDKTEKEKHTNKTYSNISESDSEPEHEDVLVQRKKVAKREKTDSGIVEDVNLSNEEGSSSSNTNQSDSEIADSSDTVDAMDVDLSDITVNKSFKSAYSSHSSSSDVTPNKEVAIAHYIDSNAFSTYMKEKIHQLPLPFSLKLYINYNRKL